MAGMALKGHCNFVSVMIPPEVSLIEKCSQQKGKNGIYCSKLILMQHFQYC